MANRSSVDNLENLKELLKSCIAGDSGSIMHFQDQFGEDIYNFPVKARHVNMDQAADFYCYCFEKNRIFKRLLSFKGLCSLRTYQYCILQSLFNEWVREEDRTIISTVPFDNLDDPGDHQISEPGDDPSDSSKEYYALFGDLNPEEKIYVKLLSYHEFGLEPSDMRMISEIFGKSIVKVMDSFIEIDNKLSERDEQHAERQFKLDEVEVRILNLERKIKNLSHKTENPERNPNQDWVELNKKLEWRRRQKEELIKKYKQIKCQLSYRDIADLLNISLGKVSEKINEIKKKISGLCNESIKADQE